MSVIPYTHWSYFPDETSARRCAEDLADYVIRIRGPIEGVPKWLLLAGRDVEVGGLVARHEEVAAIVERHGGEYDGGEATYDTAAGTAVADPVLIGWDPSTNI